MIKTNDGGFTWERIELDFDLFFNSVFFTDDSVGWLAGENGVIKKTENGGRIWTDQTPKIEHWAKIYFINESIGFVLGGRTVLRTTDGGSNWNEVLNKSNVSFRSIQFIDSNHGWIAPKGVGTTDRDRLFRTSDQGASWEEIGFVWNVRDISFIDSLRGYGVTRSGQIWKTSDGGENWGEIENYTKSSELNSISFANSTVGWAVGGHGMIHKTENGGDNWFVQGTMGGGILNAFFLDPFNGWIVTGLSKITRTNDGGKNWETTVVQGTTDIHGIYFVDSTNGWFVGGLLVPQDNDVYSYGDVYKTNDGGKTWVPSFSRSSKNSQSEELRTLYFTSPDSGWVVGDSGQLYETQDGGENWRRRNTNFPGINHVQFVDGSIGFLGGYEAIFRTDNGGGTWRELPSSGLERISFYFVDAQKGWLVGRSQWPDEKLLKTIDGGYTWEVNLIHDDSSGPSLRSVYFHGQNTGWAFGGLGLLYSTLDGGELWKRHAIGTRMEILSIKSFDDGTVWIAGRSGVLRAAVSGITSVAHTGSSLPTKKYPTINTYPNPFNAETVISFDLVKSEIVQLAIYNIMGQQVKTLLDGYMTAGNHRIKWKAGNIPSGIYFCRLKTMNDVTSKRVLLLK